MSNTKKCALKHTLYNYLYFEGGSGKKKNPSEDFLVSWKPVKGAKGERSEVQRDNEMNFEGLQDTGRFRAGNNR